MTVSTKPSQPNDEAAARLRALWRDRPDGVTQDSVGELLEVGQSAISQYMHGKIPLNYAAVLAFAAVLRVPPAAIRTDLPEQRLYVLANDSKSRGPVSDLVPPSYADVIAVTPDEAALLSKYRQADDAGKRSLHAVGNALAQPVDPANSNGITHL